MRKRLTVSFSIAVVVSLLAMLVVGMFVPAAFAAGPYRPVVKAVSPSTCAQSGGVAVVITGKFFKLSGRNVVKAVTFGSKAAVHVRVKSATVIKCVAPAGAGRVHVRVATTKGTSARVAADKFAYAAPATQMSLKAGDAQTASAGAEVAIDPSVLVQDATGKPVAGVHVTFTVATGGGSVTGGDATSNAAGIAQVGSWKLGATAGGNTLTATCDGLTGSPVTFSATGDPGILSVQRDGAAVRSYSMAELQALTAFSGWAGLAKSPAIGPDAVTGVKITDIVKDALGSPLAATQSVNVAEVDATPYNKVMSYKLLVDMDTVTFWTAADTTVQVTTYTGPMAAILVYSDPAGNVMPAASGPLRFVIADGANEGLVFKPTNLSVIRVNLLNVINP
jgi:hypothetical protein